MILGSVPIEPGTTLQQVDQVRRSRNYRPGFGGALQLARQAGYHQLWGAGAVDPYVLATYNMVTLPGTQAGASGRTNALYDVSYQVL